jgi:ATP-binding cassette subfamily B protein
MKHNFQLFRYFVPLMRPYRLRLSLAFLALSIAASAILYVGAFIRRLVDEGFSAENGAFLNQALFVLIGLSVILALAAYLRTRTTAWIAEKVVADLKTKLFNHCVLMDTHFYEQHSPGEILSRLNGDTALVRTLIAASGAVGLRSVIQLVGSIIFLGLTSFKLTLYVFLLLPVLIVPIALVGRKVREQSRITQDLIESAHIYAQETFQSIETIQSMCHETQSKVTFNEILEKTLTASQGRIASRAFFIALIIGLVFSMVSILLWLGSLAVFNGDMTMGQLSSFIFYAIVAAGSFNSLAEVIGDIQASAGSIERIYDLLMTSAVLKNPKHPRKITDTAKDAIQFQNVTFFYPTRSQRPALKNFSLHIKKGEQIAFVGPSGSGKSTLFRLLLRFYKPQQGQLLINETPIESIRLEDLRTHIAIVPQECAIFNRSLWENVRLANLEATTEEILDACRVSHIDEFVDTLPDRFQTLLGERGVRLSGGQRQRIAIARALLRRPKILLLDEATSALDAQSEDYVHKAIQSISKKHTTLIAAHRLSTVMNADRIIVIEQGEIVAQGKHHELVQENGLYARLAQKQLIA